MPVDSSTNRWSADSLPLSHVRPVLAAGGSAPNTRAGMGRAPLAG